MKRPIFYPFVCSATEMWSLHIQVQRCVLRGLKQYATEQGEHNLPTCTPSNAWSLTLFCENGGADGNYVYDVLHSRRLVGVARGKHSKLLFGSEADGNLVLNRIRLWNDGNTRHFRMGSMWTWGGLMVDILFNVTRTGWCGNPLTSALLYV